MATASNRPMTGAVALIKVNGQVVGKMRNVRGQENTRRLPVRGLGTILPSEQEVVEWEGTLSCDFIEISFKTSGIPGGISRVFQNAASQVLNGGSSFEDQLVLDGNGVQVCVFKKVTDVIDAAGSIKPKLEPYAIVNNCLIESDSFEVSEGSLAGHSQSFKYLTPIIYPQ